MVPLGVFGIGPGEWLLNLAVLVLLFGARKIPDLARGLGEGIKNFRAGMREDKPEDDDGGKVSGGSER